MKNLAVMLLLLAICSCATLREQLDNSPDPVALDDHPTGSVQPDQTLGELLKHRLFLCQQDKNLRTDQLKQIRAKSVKTRKNSKAQNFTLNDKLDGLMLATCDLNNSLGIFNEMMVHVTNTGNWPADYDAFFDLLRSQQRNITQLQGHIIETNKELEITKSKLDVLQGDYKKTIKGISEIEESLDSRKQKNPATP